MILMNNQMEQTLTEIEALGLASRYDLANGHASYELSSSQQCIIENLPAYWSQGMKQKSRDAEMLFKHAFWVLSQSPSLANYEFFKICPTASNSIDVVAAWLSEKKLKTALIEPTFDNLYLILKRRGVELSSLPEEILQNGDFKKEMLSVDAIFLVNPNNPTGQIISLELFVEIINWCAKHHKIIILDNSFRFFVPQIHDVYQLLLDSGVTFLALEDTGKVWPTQEIKASLLFCSKNIFNEIDLIYDEIFLSHSNFALIVLAEFLMDANRRGLAEAIWKKVAQRRKVLREALDGNILSVNHQSQSSMLSVEWVKIGSYFSSDLELANHFRSHHLILLPGRQFFWNHSGCHAVSHFVRFALLKHEHEFMNAVQFLKHELQRLTS